MDFEKTGFRSTGSAERNRPGMDAWIETIDNLGYCIIPQLLRKSEVDSALVLVNKWWQRTRYQLPDNMPPLAKDQPMLWNLQNKDIFFLKLLFSVPGLEAILCHFLNDRWYRAIPPDKPNYILRTYLARSNHAALPLHIDSLIPYADGPSIVMQCLIALEDMDESNGCTLVVPGSHRSARYVDQDSLKEAIPVTARAGDLVIWDSRIWHGALPNRHEENTRWSLIATFCRWWIKQGFDITGLLPATIYNQLSDHQKAILGYCSIPHTNEFSGIDFRHGYDQLPDNGSPVPNRSD